MKLVFLGPPGAGKGTIAALAKESLSIPHVSTGELFRKNIRMGTALGKKVRDILAAGNLVPDDVTVAMVKDRLAEADAERGYILDGFPRTIAQAEALAGISGIDHVVNFLLDKESIVRRLSGRRMSKSTGKIYHLVYNPPKRDGVDDETGEPLIQREDDKEEAILHRLEVYEEQTTPLIDYYRRRGLLLDIDATGTPDVVHARMLERLGKAEKDA
ncbi:adenylate kinase [Parasphaerochaeta coccoides]|uniref:Adenylate kinase n=1 Tax=Parasphaerochaeta coccoides (strain ATCC BAA-1237 / DSM 17374 / SPN1) TaxID=760011 RepID=F4GLI3_PARC1|nr:adenylate kinase [Parasphaerochaeta coccoides]AEC01953.1 Adenylate kinase [Parasphaerochaeta coccoides DSM 17374]